MGRSLRSSRSPHRTRLSPSGGSTSWSPVLHHRGHIGLHDDLPIHLAEPAHLADRAANLDDVELEPKLIPRPDRTPELDVVERHEVDDLLVRLIERSHQQHPADLCHRFDDQHAGHYRMSGKMALKERLVDRHVLHPDDALVLLDLDDPVDEKEGIPVRKNLHDVFYRVHPLYLLSSRFDDLTHKGNSSAVARLEGDDARLYP